LQQAAIQSDQNFTELATGGGGVGATRLATAALAQAVLEAVGTQQPLPDSLRQKALAEVDAELVQQGLLDKVGGNVSKRAQEEIDYQRETSIPTAGVIVKSCLDDCNICEPEV